MTPNFDPGDVERFRGIVSAQFGLQFDDSRLGFLADVLRKRLEAGRQESGHYLAALEADEPLEGEAGALAQELTVGETYFFRNNEQFRAFEELVLPERLRARRGERRLRILSAGCASGEEAYTLAMIVRKAIADASWDISIRAVDLNPVALQRAAEARYSGWALRETPPEMQRRWFTPAGREFVLADEIRSAVTFERRNLTADDPDLWRPEFYDVVFCRNVIMYFSIEKMRTVVARIAGSLSPGGFFFLGHAETLRGLSQDFHLRHSHDTFYYQARRPGEEREAPPLPPVARAIFDTPQEIVVDDASWVETIARASERIQALGTASSVNGSGGVAPLPAWNMTRVLDLMRLERFSEALELIREMPPEASEDRDVLLLTAVLLAHSGQLVAAAEVAARLMARDEMNAGGHYVLALCFEGAGEYEKARHHDQFATYLDPEFAMPRLHLGLIAKRSGECDAARRDLNQALLLLQREDPSRLLLFGGGFTREGLVALCRSELASLEKQR